MKKIIKYVLLDILRNRLVIGYTALLCVITFSMLQLSDAGTKSLPGLLNILLIVVPLVCIIFSSTYMYNSAEFIEMLAAQPIRRNRLLLSIIAGQCIAMVLAFLLGTAVPLFIYLPNIATIYLVVAGVGLSLVFTTLAVWVSVLTTEKAKGIGISVLWWFYFSVIFDAIVLFLLFQFSDYPLEKASVVLTALNPIDLARIMVMLQLDIAAMLDYTGAVFKQFFGGTGGHIFTGSLLLLWIALPVYLAVRRFNRKDL